MNFNVFKEDNCNQNACYPELRYSSLNKDSPVQPFSKVLMESKGRRQAVEQLTIMMEKQVMH